MVPEGCCPYDECSANNVTSVNGVTDTHLRESLMAKNVLGYSKMEDCIAKCLSFP